MAMQQELPFTDDLEKLTVRAESPTAKLMRFLLVVVMALFVYVGTAHADILVSNYDHGTVDKYYDDGTLKTPGFIKDVTTAEGLQCVKRSRNRVYVANVTDAKIRVYNLTTGDPLAKEDFTISGSSAPIVGMALNADGSVLYAGDNVSRHIWAVNLPIGSGPCTDTAPCHADTDWSLDVVLGPDGNVYATDRGRLQLGVKQFPPVPPGAKWSPGAGVVVVPGTTYNGHNFFNAGAMVFDSSGNLWVSNVPRNSGDAIFEFTGPLNPNPFRHLNFTTDPNAAPLGMDISPVNPPVPPFDPCKGCIAVAQFDLSEVDQIDPKSCTGTIANPGTCQFYKPTFINSDGRPKYLRFTENCNDIGYVEICKMSCSTNPVTGHFDFTATNMDTKIGPVHIPVGACSGPIQIPNGTVTIKETQQFGILVSDITAYDYDYQGYQINALLSFNKPFQTGNVNVVSGDVSTETVAGFTNCKSGPGELKICKVAGDQNVKLGDLFYFTASGDPITYAVPAGPPPNGYCVVGKSYDVGTPVLITELKKDGTKVSNITVAPPDRGGMQTDRSVIAIIDSGTTEVTFTNVGAGSVLKRCLACQ